MTSFLESITIRLIAIGQVLNISDSSQPVSDDLTASVIPMSDTVYDLIESMKSILRGATYQERLQFMNMLIASVNIAHEIFPDLVAKLMILDMSTHQEER